MQTGRLSKSKGIYRHQ